MANTPPTSPLRTLPTCPPPRPVWFFLLSPPPSHLPHKVSLINIPLCPHSTPAPPLLPPPTEWALPDSTNHRLTPSSSPPSPVIGSCCLSRKVGAEGHPASLSPCRSCSQTPHAGSRSPASPRQFLSPPSPGGKTPRSAGSADALHCTQRSHLWFPVGPPEVTAPASIAGRRCRAESESRSLRRRLHSLGGFLLLLFHL